MWSLLKGVSFQRESKRETLKETKYQIIEWKSEHYDDSFPDRTPFESILFNWQHANVGEFDDLSAIYDNCRLVCPMGPWKKGHEFKRISVDWNNLKICFSMGAVPPYPTRSVSDVSTQQESHHEQQVGYGETAGPRVFMARLFWGIRRACPMDPKREVRENEEAFAPRWDSSLPDVSTLTPTLEDTEDLFEYECFLFKKQTHFQHLAQTQRYRPELKCDLSGNPTPQEYFKMSRKVVQQDTSIPLMAQKYDRVKLMCDIGCFKKRQELKRVYLDWNDCSIKFQYFNDELVEMVKGDLVWGFKGVMLL